MTHEIIVYCDGRTLKDTLRPSHADRRANIARLEFVAAGESNLAVGAASLEGGPALTYGADMWTPHPVSRDRYRQLRNAGVTDAPEPMVSQTIGSRGVPIDINQILSSGQPLPEFHHKVVMHCPLCHLDLQFRLETISPYLDTLRHAEWDTVSLAALAAIVSK